MRAPEIAELAFNAGVRTQSGLQAAVAIALAESGGDPKSFNGRGRDESYGLWQINMKPSEVGDRKKELGISDNRALFDPATNAKAMFKISKGGVDWSPWSTWPLRAAAYMPVAIGAATGTIAKLGGQVAAERVDEALPGNPLEDVAAAVRGTTGWVSDRNNWFRVGKTVIGGVLIVGGIFLIAKPLVTNVAASEVGKIAGKALGGK